MKARKSFAILAAVAIAILVGLVASGSAWADNVMTYNSSPGKFAEGTTTKQFTKVAGTPHIIISDVPTVDPPVATEVTYNADGGKFSDGSRESAGTKSTPYTKKTFKEWTANSLTYKAGDTYTPNTDTTFAAVYTDEEKDGYECEKGTPVREGFLFAGWSETPASGEPAANTYYALWKQDCTAYFVNDESATEPSVKVNDIAMSEFKVDGDEYDLGGFFTGSPVAVKFTLPKDWEVTKAVLGADSLELTVTDNNGTEIGTYTFKYSFKDIPAIKVANAQWKADQFEYDLGSFSVGTGPSITLPTMGEGETIESADVSWKAEDGTDMVTRVVGMKASSAYALPVVYSFTWKVVDPSAGNDGSSTQGGANGSSSSDKLSATSDVFPVAGLIAIAGLAAAGAFAVSRRRK